MEALADDRVKVSNGVFDVLVVAEEAEPAHPRSDVCDFLGVDGVLDHVCTHLVAAGAEASDGPGRHIEPVCLVDHVDDGQPRQQVVCRVSCRLPQALVDRKVAKRNAKLLQPLTQDPKVPRLVLGHHNPVVKELVWKLLMDPSKPCNDVPRQVDSPRL